MDFNQFFEDFHRSLEGVVGHVPFAVITIVIVAIIAVMVTRGLTKLIRKALAGSPVGEVSLSVNIVRILVGLYAAYFVGENVFHVEMNGLVQALGITSLVVSFGMQDLVQNIVAGIQVVTGGLLKVGDQIQLGDNRGEVMDINWRQTTIRDKDGNPHVIPNSTLMGEEFCRLDGKEIRRHDIELDIKPGLDLDRVAGDICNLANALLQDRGWKSDEPTEVRYLGSTANGVRAAVRIYLVDISFAVPAVDAVMRAIGARGYLADWTNDSPGQVPWRPTEES